MASSAEEQQKNKEVIYQFFEAFDRQDIERMGQLVSSSNNYSFHFPGMQPMDWSEHKQLIGAIIRAFPDFHHNLQDMVAEGDKVAVRFTITGTHQGEFQGVAPTGKQVSFSGMDFLTVIDGKITEERLVVDMMEWMQQIGAIPTIPPPAGGGGGSSTAHS
jgi:steroid delta-isomerase-like uncharacterized protein